MSSVIATDNGGRRSGIDRRQYLYSAYTPERRSGAERRSGVDRRSDRYKGKHNQDRRETG